MKPQRRIRANTSCPCGSGQLYVDCCEGGVLEETLFPRNGEVSPEYLSVRGKNLRFLHAIGEALEVDTTVERLDWQQVKQALSTNAVRRLHETVTELWVGESDLERALLQERERSSGLFTGTYDNPKALLRGVARHSLYSESILLVDPFMDPRVIRPEYSPVEEPQKHQITTMLNLRLWLALAPWIRAGVVKLIRTPGQFDVALQLETNSVEMARYEGNPKLMEALERDNPDPDPLLQECLELMVPDRALTKRLRALNPTGDTRVVERHLEGVRRRRAENPYFVAPYESEEWGNEQFMAWSTGASYEMARLTSLLTGSHLLTNLPARWMEMELAREEAGAMPGVWDQFAKAFSYVDIKFLDGIRLEHALELRREDRLSEMRAFLADVWRKSAATEGIGEEQVLSLTHELHARLRAAEAEWTNITATLAEQAGDELADATEHIPQAMAEGNASWLGVATALRLTGRVVSSWMRKRKLRNSCPAAFLLSLKRS